LVPEPFEMERLHARGRLCPGEFEFGESDGSTFKHKFSFFIVILFYIEAIKQQQIGSRVSIS
jgi:hypothetical protein